MESCENKTGIIFPIAVFFDQIDFFAKSSKFSSSFKFRFWRVLFVLFKGRFFSNISKISKFCPVQNQFTGGTISKRVWVKYLSVRRRLKIFFRGGLI